MREILFKAKGQTDDKWHIGFLANLYGGICIIRENEHEWICKPETLCQCTGLKDNNGNLIWENDVVKGAWFDKGKRHRHIGTVSYICCAYKVVGVKQYYGLHDELNGSYTVIGNIFDNPELMNE